jgi:hypothetical protein
MMTGYHYASVENWRQIQKAGLVPYRICRPALKEYLGTDTVQGVWVWRFRLSGRSHVGSVLYQMATKNSREVILLKVRFNESDRLSVDGDVVELIHSGHFGTLEYHEGERAVVVTETIPPHSITAIDRFVFEEAWPEKGDDG